MTCLYPECPALPVGASGRCPVHQMRVVTWQGCYDESWRDLIVDEAFAHPAKMSRALVKRIFSELFETGVLTKGSTVVDPFGGIGTTAIEGASRGCFVVCCELEEKFVNLARANFDLHRQVWEGMGCPEPFIVKGDSRKLREVLDGAGLRDAVVSSPPYAGTRGTPSLSVTADEPWQVGGDISARRGGSAEYGDTEGQLGLMEVGTVEAIISSPPYEEIATGAGGLNTRPGREGQQAGRSASSPSQQTDQRYGDTPGQLAKLPKDEVDTIIGSPPFLDARSDTTRPIPPASMDGDLAADGGRLHRLGACEYGGTEGQMGAMPAGSVDVVVSSPPFGSGDSASAQSMVNRTDKSAQWVKANAGSAATMGYGEAEGQLGVMPVGDVDAVVGSPPFGQEATGHVSADKFKSPEDFLKAGRGNGASDEAVLRQIERDKDKTYGESDGQMAAMPMGDAVVSSPPYEGSLHAADHGIDWSKGQRANRDAGGENFRPGESVEAAYPRSDENIGNKSGETFWTAARDIVSECYAVLKPGGVAVWVVKAFVRNKKVVDFPGDWRKLCEHIGFITEVEVHASLVAESVRTDLWGNEIVQRRERKSFFRRLAEKKGSPPIDWETVYFMRKPESPILEGPLFQAEP